MKTNRKGKWWRRLARTITAIIVLFILGCFIFDHFVQFRKSDRELKEFFSLHHINGKIDYYKSGGRTIRYISIGSDTLPTLFFIHGSPSSLSIYNYCFSDSAFLKTFRMVAVDRPGYGGSGFGFPEPSIKKQADIIWPLLSTLRHSNKPLLIVSGSYGTSVACRLMMDHPKGADAMVLLAPSMAPGEEKVFWFSPLIENRLLRWFIPRMFQSANTEKLAHRSSLTDMLPYWKNIRVPVFYLQGSNDHLVYTTNASFARTHLINVPYLSIEFLKGRPHFFANTDALAIRSKIIECYHYIKQAQIPN